MSCHVDLMSRRPIYLASPNTSGELVTDAKVLIRKKKTVPASLLYTIRPECLAVSFKNERYDTLEMTIKNFI